MMSLYIFDIVYSWGLNVDMENNMKKAYWVKF